MPANIKKNQNRVKNRANKPDNKIISLASFLDSYLHLNTLSLISEIKEGLRYDALEDFQRCSGIPLQQLHRMLHIAERTLNRRKNAGRLQPVESDRFVRICRVYAMAFELFEGDNEATSDWLSSPQPALGNHTPFEFLETEIGTQEVQAVIGRLEHGVFL